VGQAGELLGGDGEPAQLGGPDAFQGLFGVVVFAGQDGFQGLSGEIVR